MVQCNRLHDRGVCVQMRQRETTIQDIAGAVGVSKATVSNILRGTGGTYAASTVEAVRTTARRLRYVPNAAARSLSRSQRTHMIGVVLTAGRQVLTRNGYFVQLLDGVLSAAMDRHYQVALISDAKENPNELHGYLRNGFVEGVLLFTPTPGSGVVEWATSGSFPAVVVGSVYEGARLACVDVDNEAAIRDAVHHLLERGHHRIGYIASYPGSSFTITRVKTYQETMREALGAEPNPSWTFQGDSGGDVGREGARYLWETHPELTAYLCANDPVALGALRYLREVGVRVPDDISLIGFDDTEAARVCDPPLTTLHQSIQEIGATAAIRLIEQIEEGQRTASITLFPATLIERGSVRTLTALSRSHHAVPEDGPPPTKET